MFLEGAREEREEKLLRWRMLARSPSRYLLVAVLHRVLELSFGGTVLFKVDLLEMFYGCRVEVVELCTEGCCQRDTVQRGYGERASTHGVEMSAAPQHHG